MRILYKYTSRSRPENFERGLRSIIENSESDNYAVLCSFDFDDNRADEYNKILARYYDRSQITELFGLSNNKIHAINRDLNEFKGDWDILVNMSDDMIFTVKGFDNIIRDLFREHFPNGDGFLHLPDGNQNENISTMSIMDRKYYERDKYIYHPSYVSLWCDVEATEVAKMRGCHKYVNTQLFKHLHPAWGLAPNDNQYIKTESFNSIDKQTYDERKRNGFGNQTFDSDSHIA